MKRVFNIFAVSVVLLVNSIHAQNGTGTYSTCPNPFTPCQSASSLANLICYLPVPGLGLNYAFIGFGQNINAVCSINYRCEAGITSEIEVKEVYGFIVQLEFHVQGCRKKAFKVWFIEVIRGRGCPRVFRLENFTFQTKAFNPSLTPAAIPADLAYLIFQQAKAYYPGECNIFQESPTNCYNCPNYPYGSACDTKPPIVGISLSQVQSLLLYNSPGSIRNVAQEYIDVYGICGVTVTQSTIPQPQPESSGPFFGEFCAAVGHNDSALYCNNRNTISISEILDSYGFDQSADLDEIRACTLTKLYAQGYNRRNGNMCSKCSCNDDSTTSFCNIAIIPQLSQFFTRSVSTALKDAPEYLLVRGFCETSIKTKIMKRILNVCS